VEAAAEVSKGRKKEEKKLRRFSSMRSLFLSLSPLLSASALFCSFPCGQTEINSKQLRISKSRAESTMAAVSEELEREGKKMHVAFFSPESSKANCKNSAAIRRPLSSPPASVSPRSFSRAPSFPRTSRVTPGMSTEKTEDLTMAHRKWSAKKKGWWRKELAR